MTGPGLIITTAIPDLERIKEMTDLPGLMDHLTSATINLCHQARYVEALEARILELKGLA